MKNLIRLTAIAVISLPFISSATTVAELQAQAQALLQQVAALQAQVAAQAGTNTGTVSGGGTLTPTTGAQIGISTVSCPQLGATLRLGSSGEDVSRLQQFLARDPSVYPEAQITGYFGALTQAAVQRWQVKFNIVSSGSPDSTGYGVVGPRTAAAMSLQCSGGAGVSTGTGTAPSGTVGGFIQVSPVTGQAPLSVTVVANVNTVLSCLGAVYTLNWGDGTAPQSIPVSAGSCATLSQTYKHLFLYGGTYVITLSAGGHQSTATVVVSGASGPVSTGLPAESVNASATSGQAPLTVTFSGTVTGADLGWCAGGCYSTLDYGDGTTGQVTLPVASNGVQNFALQHSYANAGTFTARLYQGQAGSGRPTVGSPMTISVTVNTTTYSYGPLAVTPNVGGNPLVVTAQFDLPSSCTGYDLSWGDGSSDATQADGGTSCAAGVVTKSFNHTYSAASSYTIGLKRGASLAKQDSVSLVISN